MNLPNVNETVFRLSRSTLVNELGNLLGKIGFSLPNLNQSCTAFLDDIGEKVVTSLEERGALIPSKLIPFGSIDLSVLNDIKAELETLSGSIGDVRKDIEEEAMDKYGELYSAIENVQSYVSDAESECSYVESELNLERSQDEIRIDTLTTLINRLEVSINKPDEDKDETSD